MRAQMGAEIIATACPFCLMTLEDAAKEKGQTVKELSEILMEVIWMNLLVFTKRVPATQEEETAHRR